MSRLAAWGLAAVTIASPLPAQQFNSLTVGIRPVQPCESHPGACRDEFRVVSQRENASAWPILLSAILPGTGQAVNGSSRALPYLAIEAFAWTAFVQHSLAYRRRRDGYRNLAASAARAAFSDIRPNGDFEYYERMTHYLEAGRYDLVAGGVIQPETDTATYNGAVWLLARRTYWTDPSVAPDMTSQEWNRAMAFYTSRAYDQLYRWSWTNAPREYGEFVTLIDESNEANRRAMFDLGVVIANHVLSTVDAYITVRLQRDHRRGDLSIEGAVPLSRLVNPTATVKRISQATRRILLK